MIYGVAVNDLPHHKTQEVEYYKDCSGKTKRRVLWQCPYYTKWFNMLTRCHNRGELEKHPTYEKASICEEWLIFSNFKEWMESQDWNGKNLDKDILFPGNTLYCPEKCVFIDHAVNKFVLEKSKKRDLPIGVSFRKDRQKYISSISCGERAKTRQLGAFNNPHQAHLAWARQKLIFAKGIASNQNDARIGKALIEKYEDILRKAIVNCERKFYEE